MSQIDPAIPPTPGDRPWWRLLSRYHWFVLIVAALAWMFDCMDQQLFVLARTPALQGLLYNPSEERIKEFSGWATGIFIFGWATGGLIFGMFCDRLGRVRTLMTTILIYSLFTGLSALSLTWWDFALYRFITGLGVGGAFAAGVTLVAEEMPAAARPYALGLLQALSAFGNMTAAGISMVLQPQDEFAGMDGWRWMFLIGVLPAILVVFIMSKLREPERWVRAREAARAGAAQDEYHKQMGDMREMFSDPTWRRHTIIGVLLAASGVMALWGIGFWTPELIRGNVLQRESPETQDWYAGLGSLLFNFGAFFGIYAFSILAGRFGRRPAFAVAYLAGLAATVMVFGFMTTKSQIWWMQPLLGFCVLMVFGGYAVYFPELYPTRLRGTGTAFCYNVARYLAVLSPVVLGLLAASFLAPVGSELYEKKMSDLTVLGSLGSEDHAFRYAALTVSLIYVVGLVVLLFAPETKDKPLPE